MKFAEGDRVAWTAKFLRSIGDYSKASAARRGTVVSSYTIKCVKSHEIVRVLWDDSDEPAGCLAVNLVAVGRIHLEPV